MARDYLCIGDIIYPMRIESSAFEHNQLMPAKYTCDGENINPPLMVSEVPEEAKSLALIMDDPDAPAGTWVHWTLWNINPQAQEISEASVPPAATEGVTSFGTAGYGGPCPPKGTHRYVFKLYALTVLLFLEPKANKGALEEAMEDAVVSQAELIGLYGRE